MIRPQRNTHRDAIDLSGLWRIRFDPDGVGRAEGWQMGLIGGHRIAIPGSWNEQLAELGAMNHVGDAWLETEMFVPSAAAGRCITLRFASADYAAEVWVNGQLAGASGAAMLPFELDIGALVQPGKMARLVLCVTNLLPEQGPTQRVSQADYDAEGRRRDEYLPAVRFDFFPYGGLNRPVHLVVKPLAHISAVRARPALDGRTGRLDVRVSASGGARVRLHLSGHGTDIEATGDLDTDIPLRIEGCRPWWPADPALYDLAVELLDADGQVIDSVSERTGFRDIRVDGTRLLLNGEPVQLKGFGKHEDFAVHGRGLNLPLLVKDFALLKWTGANSVRTSHYPYSEAFLDLADETGLLVIDEVFSINLDFRKVDATTLAAHKEAVTALIERDRNRPCVIAWSLANEPGYLGEAVYRERSAPYWAELFAHARALDGSRPLTHANVQHAGIDDPAFAEADILSINRYYGWYSEPGQIARGAARFKADLDTLAAHGKPLFIAEFGADAVAGAHATHPQQFTEEYQADMIAAYWEIIAGHPACIGGHVWNFADFRTAQHSRRVIFNLKGVFTRDRTPKRAAWTVRELWGG